MRASQLLTHVVLGLLVALTSQIRLPEKGSAEGNSGLSTALMARKDAAFYFDEMDAALITPCACAKKSKGASSL